jgi:hypothetical protein
VILENTNSIKKSYQTFFQNYPKKPFWFGNGRGKAFLELRMYNQAIKEFNSIDAKMMTHIECLRFLLRLLQSHFLRYKENTLSFFKNL